MRNSKKLVYGIGVKSNLYRTVENGKNCHAYSLWSDMLLRCTQKYWDKKPTYTGVSCSENFKDHTFFYEWCHKQVGFGNKDKDGRSWHLDKDILFKDNRHYSEDTCVFVPAKINLLLNKNRASRGEYPLGVCLYKTNGKFTSQCACGEGKQKYLGSFNTPQEAFQAYKTFKEALIKEVANEYKDQLDYRVYEALMNYEVNEND